MAKVGRVFIRLYDDCYRVEQKFREPLKLGIKVFTGKANDDKYYTHAAISDNIKDEFVGLTFGGKYTAKHEVIDHQKVPINGADPNKSSYGVWELLVSESELKGIREDLDNALQSKDLKFAFPEFFKIIGRVLGHKETYKDFRGSAWEDADIEQEYPNLVCSTFCAWVLKRNVPSVAAWLDHMGLDYNMIGPSDLSRIPTIKKLYGGIWNTYKADTNRWIVKHPEYKEYYY